MTYKVCRQVPVCVPVCEPACEPSCPPPVPAGPVSMKAGSPEWFSRLVSRAAYHPEPEEAPEPKKTPEPEKFQWRPVRSSK